MAVADYFLKIEGVPGESKDVRHKGEIEVLDWDWGERQDGTMAYGGGGGAGKVQMRDFHFTMNVNRASPKLFQKCATGEHIKCAVLVCRKAGTEQQEYLKVTFTDVLVSSYEVGGANAAEGPPVESVRLNFARIEVEYREQNAQGNLGAPVKAGYDLKQMTSF
jgi:type VI secretion system secreted protein Hcp